MLPALGRSSVVGQRDVAGLFVYAAGMSRPIVRLSCCRRGATGTEHVAEGGAELAAHGTVDDEVERIAEYDDHVDEQRGDLVRTFVDDVDVERVADDQHDYQYCQRQFDQQEHSDHGDQHQCGSGVVQSNPLSLTPVQHQCGQVALGQTTGFTAPVLLEQHLASILRPAHGVDKQCCEDDQG